MKSLSVVVVSASLASSVIGFSPPRSTFARPSTQLNDIFHIAALGLELDTIPILVGGAVAVYGALTTSVDETYFDEQQQQQELDVVADSTLDVSIPYDAAARLAFSKVPLPETEYPKFRKMWEAQQVAEATLKKKKRDLMAAANKAEQTLLKTRSIVRVHEKTMNGVSMFPPSQRSSVTRALTPTAMTSVKPKQAADAALYSDQERKPQRQKTVVDDVVVIPPKSKSKEKLAALTSTQKMTMRSNGSTKPNRSVESNKVAEKAGATEIKTTVSSNTVVGMSIEKRNGKQTGEATFKAAAVELDTKKKHAAAATPSDQDHKVKQVSNGQKVVERVAPVQPRSSAASKVMNGKHPGSSTPTNGQLPSKRGKAKQVTSRNVVEKIASVVNQKTKFPPTSVKNGKTVVAEKTNGRVVAKLETKTNGAVALNREKNGVAPPVIKKEETKNGVEKQRVKVLLEADQNQFPAKANSTDMVYRPVRRRPTKTVTLLPQDVMQSRKRADNIALFVNR